MDTTGDGINLANEFVLENTNKSLVELEESLTHVVITETPEPENSGTENVTALFSPVPHATETPLGNSSLTVANAVVQQEDLSTVPAYSQKDPTWKDEILGTGTETIGEKGDALTSAAIVLSYYGENVNPKELNDWLKANSGYQGADAIDWDKTAEYNGEDYSYITRQYKPADLTAINATLDVGHPMIVLVNNNNPYATSGTDYVVFTGYTGNTYYLIDPADGTEHTLDEDRYATEDSGIGNFDPANRIWAVSAFVPPPTKRQFTTGFYYPIFLFPMWNGPGWLADDDENYRDSNYYHAAVDLYAPAYSPVYALSEGAVTFVSTDNTWDSRYLNGEKDLGAIYIRYHTNTGQPFVAIYGHIHNVMNLEQGDTVNAGDKIAEIGNMGKNLPPTDAKWEPYDSSHLHFVIMVSKDQDTGGGLVSLTQTDLKSLVDPLNWLDTVKPDSAPAEDPDQLEVTKDLNVVREGNVFKATFTVHHDGTFHAQKIGVGGRYKGGFDGKSPAPEDGRLPDGTYPDFEPEELALPFGGDYTYEKEMTIPYPGDYEFFIYYQDDEDNYHWYLFQDDVQESVASRFFFHNCTYYPEAVYPTNGDTLSTGSAQELSWKSIQRADKYEVFIRQVSGSGTGNLKKKVLNAADFSGQSTIAVDASEIWGEPLLEGTYHWNIRCDCGSTKYYDIEDSAYSPEWEFTIISADSSISYTSTPSGGSVFVNDDTYIGTTPIVNRKPTANAGEIYQVGVAQTGDTGATGDEHILSILQTVTKDDNVGIAEASGTKVRISKYGYENYTTIISEDQVGEIEVNATLTPTTPPAELTDILIPRVWTSEIIQPGGEAHLNIEVRNDGDTGAGPFVVRAWWYNTSLIMLGEKEISYLQPHSSTVISDWAIQWPDDYESHAVLAFADADSAIDETEESNNLFAGTGKAREIDENTLIARFTTNITSGIAPLAVQFTDTSTGNPTAWLWDFGDGNTSTEQHPVHTYTAADTYMVSLTAISTAGEDTLTQTDCISVTTPSSPGHLIAAFTGTPRSGSAPLAVQFTDTSTGNPSYWAWYFGDEEFTGPWTQMTANAGWMGRYDHSSVVLPDGSIVLMGGKNSTDDLNDVWRSTDKGTTWTQVTADAGWSARSGHSSVVLPDGSIVLMGGSGNMNDVWRSTDKGATWTQMTADAEWTGRSRHTSVALPDGSIVLMGGITVSFSGGYSKTDVWRSTDKGATWTQMTADAEWAGRYSHSSAVLPDGSIVLIGGSYYKNDTWRSTNNGATWTQIAANAEWTGRYDHSGVALPDGSIVLMGGESGSGGTNEVWRLMTAGSSEQNPTHTYTIPDTYTVSLTATNTGGSSKVTKSNYINNGVTAPLVTNPAATPTVIPTDTDASPATGETAVLSVTVTGAVASVTVNLTAIGGSATAPMTDAGDGTWTTTATATIPSPFADGAYLPVHLPVNATNTDGVSNTTATIPLTVVKNGDVNEDNRVTLYDAVYIARHTLEMEGYPMTKSVGIVSGGDDLSLHDAMYLAKHVLAVPGYEQLH